MNVLSQPLRPFEYFNFHLILSICTFFQKLITAGTEQFNKKPSGGVAFLMEQGVLQTPMDPWEVARFIHQNPAINKQVLGDYLGNKKYSSVLEAYVR